MSNLARRVPCSEEVQIELARRPNQCPPIDLLGFREPGRALEGLGPLHLDRGLIGGEQSGLLQVSESAFDVGVAVRGSGLPQSLLLSAS